MCKYLLFSCKEHEKLANDLTENSNIDLVKIDWNFFPDGTPNFFIHDIGKVENSHIIFLASFLNSKERFHQLSILRVLAESFPKSINVVLPFFPTATMERVDKEGQIATANVESYFLSAATQVQGVRRRLIVFDIHTLQNRFYQDLGSFTRLVSAVPLFKKEIQNMEKVTIAFPDDGAHKRFGSYFSEYPVIICGKVRHGDERRVTIKEGEPFGRHVFIVDDLVQSGGTLIECKKALQIAGADYVSAFVTHAVFPRDSHKKFIEGEGKDMEHFFVTNSNPTISSMLENSKPFKVLKIDKLVYENLL